MSLKMVRFLETRFGNCAGHAVLGLLGGLVLPPVLLFAGRPTGIMIELINAFPTGSMAIFTIEGTAAFCGAVLGVMRGSRLGPGGNALVGLAAGAILSGAWTALGIYDMMLAEVSTPQAVFTACAITATICGFIGLIMGYVNLQTQEQEADLALDVIRRKSRPRLR